MQMVDITNFAYISTHSRAKAAGKTNDEICMLFNISTHSRAKAAGSRPLFYGVQYIISTHSRAKAAGVYDEIRKVQNLISTHSRAKAAGTKYPATAKITGFQLTAARRRLAMLFMWVVLR